MCVCVWLDFGTIYIYIFFLGCNCLGKKRDLFFFVVRVVVVVLGEGCNGKAVVVGCLWKGFFVEELLWKGFCGTHCMIFSF